MKTSNMENPSSIMIAIAWCLAWGDEQQPKYDLAVLQQMRQALKDEQKVPEKVRFLVEQVQQLQDIDKDYFPKTLGELKSKYSDLWNQTNRIGLVYGGATKIKQYVFEATKLPDIRGASALLDRINLVDLPAFFSCENHPDYEQCQRAKDYCKDVREEWLDKAENFPELSKSLIPELIIYSTGGNILAFCPAAFVDDLANAIEKRYTEETLTANSCAVGDKFKPLEIRFGLLPNQIDKTFWLEKYNSNIEHPLIRAYFPQPDVNEPLQAFQERKSFNELVSKLTSLFNQRRSGNCFVNRPSRRYPAMFETHPYLMRDGSDRRSAIVQVNELPDIPKLSETIARKRIIGQIAKREVFQEKLPVWFRNLHLNWQPVGISIKSWVAEFEDYLKKKDNNQLATQYYAIHHNPEEARSLRELGNVYNGFVAYIYADGNNIGGYIQKIKSPEAYQKFSKDIFNATEESVYEALAQHLKPHKLKNLTDPDNENRNGCWIHPFEILTIGGDDVMLIVPADKALAIAKTIGEEFEKILLKKGFEYKSDRTYKPLVVHRYQGKKQVISDNQCKLSMSTGVLITAEDTPIYYAEKLINQLLKSAKKRAKELKKDAYYGGTVDFLVMKSVTMISSNINEFRSNALTKIGIKQQKLKLYAAPYTLHELGGLLETAKAFKDAEFPRSQLYQIRSLLERGKQTAILNYRYFRVRLIDKKAQDLLKTQFEEAWCKPKENNNNGNLAPWMSLKEGKEETEEKVTYETIWRDLVDLYPFIAKAQKNSSLTKSKQQTLQS